MGVDGHTLYAINMNGNVFKSSDAGSTFVRLNPSPELAKLMGPHNPATFMRLVRSYGIEKSDGGTTLRSLKTRRRPSSSRSIPPVAIYIAGPATVAYVSSDGGAIA